MTSVTRDVYLATKERQRPWVNASLISEVYLNQKAAPAPQVAAVQSESGPAAAEPVPALTEAPKSDDASIAWDREKILFESAQKSGAAEDYQSYLAAYPQGQFAGIAQNFIARAANNAAPVGTAAQAGNTAQADNAATEPTMTVAALPQADMTRTSGASPETVAPAAASLPPAAGTSLGEAALGWDQSKRREVQMRLELTGREVGNIDGNFGARTRAAVSDWQRVNGLDGTGFFTAEQLQMLVAQTEEAYKQQTEASPKPAQPRRVSAGTRDKTSAGAKEKTRGKTIAKKPASTNQAQSKRRTNQAQADEPAASPPKRQRPAGHVDLQFGFGHESTIYSDDPCLTHPGHRIINGICIY